LGVDLLAADKEAEAFATHSNAGRKSQPRHFEEEKIDINQFNTAALDDLLGGGEPQP
jgi:hypothetical protein